MHVEKEKRTSLNQDKIFAIACILFSLGLLPYAIKMPLFRNEIIGPGFWPLVILSLFLVLSIVMLLRSGRFTEVARQAPLKPNHRKSVSMQRDLDEGTLANQTEKLHPLRHWYVLASTLFYIIAVQFIGFAIATPLFIISTSRSLGVRHWLKSILIALLCSVLIITLFTSLLSVPLPRGIGVFRLLSYFFY